MARPESCAIMHKTGGIIVEGAEQVGKSTFCERLSSALHLPLVHMHKEYGFIDGRFDYFHSYFVDIEKTSTPLVFDRFYISELVYGSFFNRSNITPQIHAKIEKRLRDLGYLVVLLTHEKNAWIDREEMITCEQNEQIAQSFNDTFETLRVPKMKINARDSSALGDVIDMYRRLP